MLTRPERRGRTSSKQWMLKCPNCQFERSYWDAGGIRWKAQRESDSVWQMPQLRTKRRLVRIQKRLSMSESKPQSLTFTCPKCGAPQNYQGGAAPTIQCPYCDTTLIVPEALRTTTPNFAAFNTTEITREAAVLAEIKKLADDGKKIQAIKLYRETFGTGLKEAKDAVEAIERGQNIQVAQIGFGAAEAYQIASGGQNITIGTRPGGGVQVATSKSNSGCVTWVIVLIVVIVIHLYRFAPCLECGHFRHVCADL